MSDSLVQDIVREVLGKLASQQGGGAASAPAILMRQSTGHGIFDDPGEACEAAHEAYVALREKGVGARGKAIEIMKTLVVRNAQAWARAELDETKIGRLDHKIEKLEILPRVPGVEFLRPDARSGDHGLTLEEYTPFGVIAAVTPSTHSIPTLTGNAINMIAAGNAVVFNTHPSATNCAIMAARAYNEAFERELGIRNLITVIARPTVETFEAICTHDRTRLICVTGGPGVVKAAMKTGKRAICAGPGNPPVVVAEDADMERAARAIVRGAAYDNNLLCIGEKEVFVVERVADALMAAMKRHGAVQLTSQQIERLTQEAFNFTSEGVGCPRAHLNKDLVGVDAAVLAKRAGMSLPDGTQLLFGETDAMHPFVQEEQMMPFLPIVRVRDIDEAIAAAAQAEHGYSHTSLIHTHNVSYMTRMGREMNTTLFVKNGPCMAGLALDGEGYLSFTIATPTGEGVTNPRTFTRVRRCTMVDDLRIY